MAALVLFACSSEIPPAIDSDVAADAAMPSDTGNIAPGDDFEEGVPEGCTGRADGEECFEVHQETIRLRFIPEIASVERGELGVLLITLKQGSDTPEQLTKSAVLMRPALKNKKGSGVLNRIAEINRDGDLLTIQTEPAKMTEAFKKFRLKRKVAVQNTNTKADGVSTTWDCSFMYPADSTQGQVGLETCDVKIGLEADLQLEFGFGTETFFRMVFTGDLQFDAMARAWFDVEYYNNPEKELFDIDFPIPGTQGLLDVSLSLVAGAEFDVDATGEILAGFGYSKTVSIGCQYKNGEFSIINEDRTTKYTSGPTVDLAGHATTEAYLKARLGLETSGLLAGSSFWIQIKPYVQASLVAKEDCKQTFIDDVPKALIEVEVAASAGLTIYMGYDLGIFGIDIAEGEKNLYQETWDIVSPTVFDIPKGDCCGSGNHAWECHDNDKCQTAIACNGMHECVYEQEANCCSNDADCEPDNPDPCRKWTCEVTAESSKCKSTVKPFCQCGSDADCDDGNECTNDACFGENSLDGVGICNHNQVSNCTPCQKVKDCDISPSSCETILCLGGKCVYNTKDEPGCCSNDADCGVPVDPCNEWICSAGECKTVFEDQSATQAKEGECCATADDCEDGLSCPLGNCVNMMFGPGGGKPRPGK
jgi:hypothetical protein